MLETDGGGAVTAVNTFGPAGLLSRQAGGASTFYAFDARGNVAQRLDGQGGVLSSDLYGAYGRKASGNPNGDPFGFGGQAGYYTDPETGLCLLGQREYDPQAGRFLTRDPAGYAGGMDLYAYADDDPVGEMDPSGLAPDCDSDDGLQCDNQYTSDLYARDPSMVQAGLNAGNFFAHAVPGLGTGLDAHDALTGCDALSGQPLSTGQRVWDGVGALLALAPLARYLRLPKCLFGCFVAGTPVQMADGTTRPVQEVKTGDVVESRDPATGRTEARRVTATERHRAPEVITVSLADASTGRVAQTLEATPEHPFFVAGRGPVPLGALGVGTQIVTRAGPPLVVSALDRRGVAGGVWVYNFTVEGDHTYFVGIANGGAWVHNSCGSWTSPGGLEYGLDKSFGNRVMHVFQHLAEGSKKLHTVFNVGTSGDLLDLIDEAWGKHGMPVSPKDPGAYVINMGRTIGTRGETSIRIVVFPGTNRIITAYPVL